jgi:hypothetical protein
MDDILGVILVLLCWRVLLCAVPAVYVAVWLAQTFAWVSAPQGIALALSGMAAGWAWNELATRQPVGDRPEPEPARTSNPVLLSGFVVGGAIWGALSAANLGAMVFGLLLLLAVATVTLFWQSAQRGQPLEGGIAGLCYTGVLAGFALAIALVRLLPALPF